MKQLFRISMALILTLTILPCSRVSAQGHVSGTLWSASEVLDALRASRIAGAALDVFEFEPEVSPGLLELENVVLTPHLGSATRETREAMGLLAVSALRSFLLDGVVPPRIALRQPRRKRKKAQREQLREFSSVRWLNIGEVHNTASIDRLIDLLRLRCGGSSHHCGRTGRGNDRCRLLFVDRSDLLNITRRLRN